MVANSPVCRGQAVIRVEGTPYVYDYISLFQGSNVRITGNYQSLNTDTTNPPMLNLGPIRYCNTITIDNVELTSTNTTTTALVQCQYTTLLNLYNVTYTGLKPSAINIRESSVYIAGNLTSLSNYSNTAVTANTGAKLYGGYNSIIPINYLSNNTHMGVRRFKTDTTMTVSGRLNYPSNFTTEMFNNAMQNCRFIVINIRPSDASNYTILKSYLFTNPTATRKFYYGDCVVTITGSNGGFDVEITNGAINNIYFET